MVSVWVKDEDLVRERLRERGWEKREREGERERERDRWREREGEGEREGKGKGEGDGEGGWEMFRNRFCARHLKYILIKEIIINSMVIIKFLCSCSTELVS